jgi:hypothetical protein
MMNLYEVEHMHKRRKANLDRITREGWKWQFARKKKGKVPLKNFSGISLLQRECLDC